MSITDSLQWMRSKCFRVCHDLKDGFLKLNNAVNKKYNDQFQL